LDEGEIGGGVADLEAAFAAAEFDGPFAAGGLSEEREGEQEESDNAAHKPYDRALRLFLSQRIPTFDRVVVIESGSRQLLEDLLPGLYEIYGEGMELDLVTCYAGVPKGFRAEQGRVWRITEYPGAAGRAQVVRELRARRHSIAGIICSNEPIMTKWKWMLAARLPAKLFVLNENGDYFWVDRGNWSTLFHFALYRAGLTGAGAVVTIGRILLFPVSVLYLLTFAGVVHFRRRVRG
jgi:hypothetical protein